MTYLHQKKYVSEQDAIFAAVATHRFHVWYDHKFYRILCMDDNSSVMVLIHDGVPNEEWRMSNMKIPMKYRHPIQYHRWMKRCQALWPK